MSGYYPPNQQIPPQYYTIDPSAVPNPNYQNAPPMMTPRGSISHGVPENPIYQGMPGSFVYTEPHMQQTYGDHYDDNSPDHGGNARMRRRSAQGDSVKHRRTRSGCYTCRQRRVKCDETRPMCERCRKGTRECVYPDPSANTKGRSGSKSSHKSGTDVSSPEDHDHEDEEFQDRLPAILDNETEDVDTDSKPGIKREPLPDVSDTPSLINDPSPSPSTEASSTANHPIGRPTLSRKSSHQQNKPVATPIVKSSSSLPPDVKFYLDYFKNNMSYHHYSLKRDSDNFFKREFLAMAIKHEPLRYAVVGYAAYFHTLTRPEGRISHFLQYYNESVSRLRASITKNKKQGLSTFLTILQLASIEEVLGDWVNLMGHQKAAYEILTRLYTPETITHSSLLRKVLLWYIRFDLFVGFQSGGEAVLDREWYVTIHEYYKTEARQDPDNLTLKYEERFAYSRLVAKDSSDLFARKGKGLITDEQFMQSLLNLAERVNNLAELIDPALLDPIDFVTDLEGDPDPEDIINPYEVNVIWKGPRWTSNYLVLDMYGIIFMFHIQVAQTLRRPFPDDLQQKAIRAAQVFEAICKYPQGGPPGAIIEAQASLAIATLFLPKDQKTIQWCRRTFAKIEASGYIYSNFLRNKMLEQWGFEHSDWWLPNDEECPRIIRSIKNFIHERTVAPKDQTSEDLREMKGIFSTLTISESPPDETMGDTPIEGSQGSVGVPSIPDESVVFSGGSPDWNYESKFSSGEGYGSSHFLGQ